MGLTLVTGPANAGKIARLLDGYLAALDRDPVLIVPNRADVEQVERQLLALTPTLLGGTIVTFADLFERIAGNGGRRVASKVERAFVVRRAIASSRLNGLGSSARSPGFAETLSVVLSELGSSLVSPSALEGDLGGLYEAYRIQLDRAGLIDAGLVQAEALRRLESDLASWQAQPLFAYGFEDLTEAEWRLLQALAGRAEITVSLPYEPGRAAFAALQTTSSDLASLAAGRVEELPPAFAGVAHPAIAHLERALFGGAPSSEPPPLEGAVRFLEGAGVRGVLELVAEEAAVLVRAGTPPERIGAVCPSLERWHGAIETVFGALDLPYAVEAPRRLPETAFGHALVSLLRFAWLGGDRRDLFAYLRSPFSGLSRTSVDFVEGRLRGRAVAVPERVEEEMEALRGAPLPALQAVREGASATAAARALAAKMARASFGLESPPVGRPSIDDLRAHEACSRLLDELDAWERAAGPLGRDDVVSALDRATVRMGRPAERGRVAVLDLMRARTRRFDVVFVLGLEEGSLPRRLSSSPFLDDEARTRLGPRLRRRDQVAYDRYLFYTACARPTRRLYLVREAATDDGSPREASPFWEEAASAFAADDVARWTRRRPLSALTWPVEAAPSERERLRAVARLASDEETEPLATALARASGWERRLERARSAFRRTTRLRHPLVLEQLHARTTFNVTELERFADCSSAWLFERFLDPKTIDAEPDARLRGQVAHTALQRFFSGLPKELGTARVPAERVDDALGFLDRCLQGALDGVRMEMTTLQRQEFEQGLRRDLEQLVRDEAASDLTLEPRRFEVSFGSERSAPELQGGVGLGDGLRLSGKIDRVDVDPFTARGIVQDYKAGKGAHSARTIERELRLQIPLYMLVLRDLVGIEPLGGLYRPLAGGRKPRGLLRAGEDAVPGFARADYVPDEEFWAQVERARTTAGRLAERIRGGDVRHDPRGDECPSWCDLWPMCRVRRA